VKNILFPSFCFSIDSTGWILEVLVGLASGLSIVDRLGQL
jgi:hypothetical protein